MEDIAAHNLLNRTLQEGWRVVEKKEKKARYWRYFLCMLYC